jgi:hypothetical protein
VTISIEIETISISFVANLIKFVSISIKFVAILIEIVAILISFVAILVSPAAASLKLRAVCTRVYGDCRAGVASLLKKVLSGGGFGAILPPPELSGASNLAVSTFPAP